MADTPPKPRPSRTVKEGWAFKQGPPPWKNWKKRYLALNEAGIFYFKSAKKTKAELKGSIPLASIASITSGQEAKRKFCLKLETPGRNYMFSFDDERELKGWADAIEKEKDKNKQGTLKKMRKRESASTTKLEELFIPPSPTSPPRQQEPAAVPVSQSNIESKQDAENRKAAMKEKRKLEREKKKSEKKAQKSASVLKKREEALAKKESKKKGTPKKEPEPAEAPTEEIFRTMLVHPFQESVGEFKEYLPDSEPKGFFPSKEELESLSRSKLKEVDKDIDRERDMQIKAIKTKYAAQKIEIIAILAEKEVIAIAERYGAERRAILEELKNRGVEG